MARRLVWSPEAVEDIESIATFISRDSEYYARTVVARIVHIAELIPENPELGRIVAYSGEGGHRFRLKPATQTGKTGHPRSDSDAGFAYCYSEPVAAVNNDCLLRMDSPLRLIL